MNFEGLYQVAVLALATAAISVTTSKARVFASARRWIASRSDWFGDLVSCTYCTSHWVAIAFVAIYRPVIVHQWIVIDLIVSVFTTVALSAIISGAIIKLNPFHGDALKEVGNNFEESNAGNAGNVARRY
jgi:hypothetical protein